MMDNLPVLEVNDGPNTYFVQVLDDDLLSADTKAIRVRGPKGVIYAKPSLGAWKVIGAKMLRHDKEMGFA